MPRSETAARERDSFYADLHGEKAAIRVCRGTSCWLAGGEEVRRLHARKGPTRGVYCLGWCDRSPALLHPDGRTATGANTQRDGAVDPDDARPDIRCLAPEAVVTARIGRGCFARLDDARAAGAYRALERALELAPGAILEALERSGERGRGGAGYSTGAKWRACAQADGDERFVIANGDEGDPGSFVDRVLMEDDPHAVIEGLLLCAYAIGAHSGIVFIRSEYPRARGRMQAAIEEARAAGLLGPHVLGSDFACDVSVFAGMGSYVCGEETALLNAIEGRRGEVRLRPPYPTTCGLYGKPTVVNNVETLANVPAILSNGPEWYAKLGTARSAGTVALCLNSGFSRPGIVEVEFGTPLQTVIDEGGGGRDGRRLEAVLLGGPMGSVVLPGDWDVPIGYDAMAERGIQLGHGGLVALLEGADLRALLVQWLEFMRDESCGRCAPCRLGSAHALELAARAGGADRAELENLFDVMEAGSLCAFGQLLPRTLRQLASHFGDRLFGDEGSS